MAADVESQLVLKLQVNEFSLQLDETTLPDNSALLMAFARFLDVDGIREELIFALKLTTDTKGESIFKKLEAYFEENNIPLKNIVACATDGAAAMIGRYRGFSAYLKKYVPNVVCARCVVYRQHLVAKNLAGVWDSVISFLSETELGQKLVDAKSDILYLLDIIEKLNVLNKELQGNDSSLFSRKEAITAFIGNLKLFWLNIGRWEFAQFPSLASISTELLDAALAVHVNHLKQLHNDMETCFSSLLQMTVPDWFLDPFIADASEVDVTLN
ncbi:protein FAM200C-like [Oratosquilla oratoria]|uniref:protein FAM200C-like n=1 Tax=Oratosquilla oratoria TaxID=337810 RepID=UPI003F75A067